MKKMTAVMLCLILLSSFVLPVSAESQTRLIYSNVNQLDNGITVVEEVFDVSQSRSTDKTYVRRSTFTRDGETIAVIAFNATYRYDGTAVSVISKSVTQTDTYNGWSFNQKSFTSSGGTVTLTGKLTKWLVLNTDISMAMTCDKNGNVSHH